MNRLLLARSLRRIAGRVLLFVSPYDNLCPEEAHVVSKEEIRDLLERHVIDCQLKLTTALHGNGTLSADFKRAREGLGVQPNPANERTKARFRQDEAAVASHPRTYRRLMS